MPSSPWVDYQNRWKSCTACPLHATALEHVIYRGDRPCQVLFIGEAPGPTEDLVGSPFIGPAGKLLDKCLDDVRTDLNKLAHEDGGVTAKFNPAQFTSGFANILCCFPIKDPTRAKAVEMKEGNFRAPTKDEAATCRPHLTELVELLSPLVIVVLGKSTASHIPKHWKKPPTTEQMVKMIQGKRSDEPYKPLHYLEVSHPSYWLRTGGHKGLEFKKARLALGDYLWEVFT